MTFARTERGIIFRCEICRKQYCTWEPDLQTAFEDAVQYASWGWDGSGSQRMFVCGDHTDPFQGQHRPSAPERATPARPAPLHSRVWAEAEIARLGYRACILQYHPDRGGCHEAMVSINLAAGK